MTACDRTPAGCFYSAAMSRVVQIVVALALIAPAAASAAPVMDFEVVANRPHDPRAFTQGLVAHGRMLLESTGLEGASSVRRVDPATGRVVRRVNDPPQLFGEGLTVLRGVAWQLTWRDGVILAFGPTRLDRRGARAYPREGWGLTTDGTSLIASDGSATLRWLNPTTLATRRTVVVRDEDAPVSSLNELEMINGAIWANVWPTGRVAIIDPTDGHVRAWLDLDPLDPMPLDPDAVANGIAVDPLTRLPLVTGKRWPRMYVIRPEGAVPA